MSPSSLPAKRLLPLLPPEGGPPEPDPGAPGADGRAESRSIQSQLLLLSAPAPAAADADGDTGEAVPNGSGLAKGSAAGRRAPLLGAPAAAATVPG